MQIAFILGVPITTISGSFKGLYSVRLRLQNIIASLENFRTQTQDLKTRFVALSAALKTVSITSQSLIDVWVDVAARMGTVAEDMDRIPAPKAQQLKNAWAKVATDAKEFIDVLQSFAFVTASTEFHRVITVKFNENPEVPTTADEIRLHRSAAVHGHDAPSTPHKNSHPLRSSDDEKVFETILKCAYYTTSDLFP